MEQNFLSSRGQTILEAAEQNGIQLPYSCKNARCNTCKCKILGDSEATTDEIGLSSSDIANGFKLACSRIPKENIFVEIDNVSHKVLYKPELYPAKISALKLLSSDIISVELRLPPSRSLLFRGGQFVDVIVPDGVKRSYSLALYDNKKIVLEIKKIENGQASNYWFEKAKIDDLVRLNGPWELFVLNSTPEDHVIFLATGTGIAPIKTMLHEIQLLDDQNKPSKVSLFWGNRYSTDFYCDPTEALQGISYFPVISRKEKASNCFRGYVQDIMLENIADFQNSGIYACGSSEMIKSVTDLIGGRIPNTTPLYSDAFVATK